MFDDIKNKAKDLAREHGDSIDEGIEKTGNFIDEKTGNKHTAKIEKAQEQARKVAGKLAGTDDDPPR